MIPSLNNVTWISLVSNSDGKGILTSIESSIDIPFKIERVFYLHNVSSDRMGHTHLETDQVLIALSGNFVIDLSDGKENKTFLMNDPSNGLFIPRMIYRRMYNFSKNAICLVLANTHYDKNKSIRSWDEYLKILKSYSGE